MHLLRDSGRLLVLAALLVLPACGSPSKPSTASVAGNWSGSLTSTGSTVPAPFTMVLTQDSSAVSGTFSLIQGVDLVLGNVSGTTTATNFSGTLVVPSFNCSATIAGNAGGTQLTWTSAGFAGGFCTPTPFTATVTKQ